MKKLATGWLIVAFALSSVRPASAAPEQNKKFFDFLFKPRATPTPAPTPKPKPVVRKRASATPMPVATPAPLDKPTTQISPEVIESDKLFLAKHPNGPGDDSAPAKVPFRATFNRLRDPSLDNGDAQVLDEAREIFAKSESDDSIKFSFSDVNWPIAATAAIGLGVLLYAGARALYKHIEYRMTHTTEPMRDQLKAELAKVAASEEAARAALKKMGIKTIEQSGKLEFTGQPAVAATESWKAIQDDLQGVSRELSAHQALFNKLEAQIDGAVLKARSEQLRLIDEERVQAAKADRELVRANFSAPDGIEVAAGLNAALARLDDQRKEQLTIQKEKTKYENERDKALDYIEGKVSWRSATHGDAEIQKILEGIQQIRDAHSSEYASGNSGSESFDAHVRTVNQAARAAIAARFERQSAALVTRNDAARAEIKNIAAEFDTLHTQYGERTGTGSPNSLAEAIRIGDERSEQLRALQAALLADTRALDPPITNDPDVHADIAEANSEIKSGREAALIQYHQKMDAINDRSIALAERKHKTSMTTRALDTAENEKTSRAAARLTDYVNEQSGEHFAGIGDVLAFLGDTTTPAPGDEPATERATNRQRIIANLRAEFGNLSSLRPQLGLAKSTADVDPLAKLLRLQVMPTVADAERILKMKAEKSDNLVLLASLNPQDEGRKSAQAHAIAAWQSAPVIEAKLDLSTADARKRARGLRRGNCKLDLQIPIAVAAP